MTNLPVSVGDWQFVSGEAIVPAEWDRVVHESSDGWVFALSGWQRLILAVPEWGLQDLSFGVTRDGRLTAVMPLQFQASNQRMAASGWGLAGPIVAASDPQPDKLRAALLARARELAREHGAQVLEVGRSAMTGTSLAAPDAPPFADAGFVDHSVTTKVVALDRDESELWAGLSKNARQMIARARENGYRVRQGRWLDMVDAYYRVHVETYTRTGVSPQPRGYFEGIAREMSADGHSLLWVGESPDGDPIAFHNTAQFGPGAQYHTGCSATAHLDSGINYLLMWEAIAGAKRAGRQWYEIGEVYPDADGKRRGLSVFKSKFGGEERRAIKATMTFAPPARPDDAEARLQRAFREGDTYRPSTIVRAPGAGDDYVDRLLVERFALVRRYYQRGTAVDLCCATGSHLIEQAGHLERVIGVDFSERYLDVARSAAQSSAVTNATFVQADARHLPFAANSVGFLYCFSSLYVIPDADAAIVEIGRVLEPGGRAVLDLGNIRSLNAVSLQHYPDWAPPQLLSLRQIADALRAAGLRAIDHRRFQLLPLWSDRPSWLWPLLHPRWKALLKRRVFGKMLDEWVSSLPILRSFAFRHLIVCERTASPQPHS